MDRLRPLRNRDHLSGAAENGVGWSPGLRLDLAWGSPQDPLLLWPLRGCPQSQIPLSPQASTQELCPPRGDPPGGAAYTSHGWEHLQPQTLKVRPDWAQCPWPAFLGAKRSQPHAMPKGPCDSVSVPPLLIWRPGKTGPPSPWMRGQEAFTLLMEGSQSSENPRLIGRHRGCPERL